MPKSLRTPKPSLKCLLISGAVVSFLLYVNRHRFSSKPPSELSKVPADAKIFVPELLKHMNWTEHENVLDYGCGEGTTGYYLLLPKVREHHGHQYCLEMQEKNVVKAKATYPDPRVTYVFGNLLEETLFPDMKFDKIFAIYVFHLIPDLDRILQKFRKINKPGGMLGFTTLTENNFVFQMNLGISKNPKFAEYMANYETSIHPRWSRIMKEVDVEDRLMRLFHRSGFELTFLKIGNASFTTTRAGDYLDSLLYWTPTFMEVPEHLIPDLKKEMRRQFTLITGLSENAENFSMNNEYIIGVAKSI